MTTVHLYIPQNKNKKDVKKVLCHFTHCHYSHCRHHTQALERAFTSHYYCALACLSACLQEPEVGSATEEASKPPSPPPPADASSKAADTDKKTEAKSDETSKTESVKPGQCHLTLTLTKAESACPHMLSVA